MERLSQMRYMNRRLVSLYILTVLLVSTFSTLLRVQKVEASGTIYIRADGSIDPPDAPITTGDNVTYIFAGNVSDSIVVERDNITVDGQGYTVQGTGSGAGISSGRSNVTIKDMTIKAFDYGIYFDSSSNDSISGNYVGDSLFHGIRLDFCSGCDVSGNNITASSDYGMWLYSVSNCSISGNNITNNNFGIWMGHSSNNKLVSNSMAENKYNFGVWGGGPELSFFANDIDVSNTVDGKPIYYWINKRDMTVPLDAGYVALVNCTRMTVQDLNLTNNGQGVLLAYTTNSTITENNLTKNEDGISLESSSDYNSIHRNNVTANSDVGIFLDFSSDYNSVYENNVTSNYCGIVLTSSSEHNNVYDNDVAANTDCGIWLHSSSDYNCISANNVTQHDQYGTGIFLYSSSCCSVSGNSVTNSQYGVSLEYSSDNNSVYGNSVAGNMYGIYLISSSNCSIYGNNITIWYGVYFMSPSDCSIYGNNITCWASICLMSPSNCSIYGNNITNGGCGIQLHFSSDHNSVYGNNITSNFLGISLDSSSDNSIYHNNFVGNTQQIDSYGSTNLWDDAYPSGGNYWSDYNGTDSDNDGIGEPGYVIDANNTDNYPLMSTFTEFNATSECLVQTICNSSISSFQFNGTSIRFNVTGENGTFGFCRICIPTALMNATYRVFVNGTEVQCNLLPCSNSTHSYLYFTYSHSTKEIVIIPELVPLIILPLFMITTLLAAIAYKRKSDPE